MTCHARTSSDPPLPHPIVIKLEEELGNLKTSLSTTSSPPTNTQILCTALRELGNVYKSIDDLLCLQSLIALPHQKKWVEEQLDGSIKLLDLIECTKDCMVLMREHVQDLRSAALRKKGENVCVASKKKLEREIQHCNKLLKQIDSSCFCTSLKDWDAKIVDLVLMDSKEICIALLRSILCLLSTPKCKAMAIRWGWGFASKDGISECTKERDQLKELEGIIEGLENGLEFLFRRLIQNRVSLLNIMGL